MGALMSSEPADLPCDM